MATPLCMTVSFRSANRPCWSSLCLGPRIQTSLSLMLKDSTYCTGPLWKIVKSKYRWCLGGKNPKPFRVCSYLRPLFFRNTYRVFRQLENQSADSTVWTGCIMVFNYYSWHCECLSAAHTNIVLHTQRMSRFTHSTFHFKSFCVNSNSLN